VNTSACSCDKVAAAAILVAEVSTKVKLAASMMASVAA
jgi:hypothetical protein